MKTVPYQYREDCNFFTSSNGNPVDLTPGIRIQYICAKRQWQVDVVIDISEKGTGLTVSAFRSPA